MTANMDKCFQAIESLMGLVLTPRVRQVSKGFNATTATDTYLINRCGEFVDNELVILKHSNSGKVRSPFNGRCSDHMLLLDNDYLSILHVKPLHLLDMLRANKPELETKRDKFGGISIYVPLALVLGVKGVVSYGRTVENNVTYYTNVTITEGFKVDDLIDTTNQDPSNLGELY